jgi:hypothetical protein
MVFGDNLTGGGNHCDFCRRDVAALMPRAAAPSGLAPFGAPRNDHTERLYCGYDRLNEL